MKKIIFLVIIIITSTLVSGQDSIRKIALRTKNNNVGAGNDSLPWNISGFGSVNFNQASFNNWASGGQNSIGLSTFLSLQANYKKKKQSWKNNLDMGYGFQLTGNGSKPLFTKTDDRIQLTSIYGYGLTKTIDFSVLVDFRTQFANGYNYPDDSNAISKFMAPGYLIAGIGINFVPTSYFSAYISPASGRFTFVLDDSLSARGACGVKKGEKMRGEFGPYVRLLFNKDIFKNVNLNTNVDLFTDYFHDFGCIDVNWSLMLTMKVNKWLAASLTTQLIYDNDIIIKNADSEGPRTQFKELFGIGLSYKFD
jgi:hypothetical protein